MRNVFIIIIAVSCAFIILSGETAMSGAARGFEVFISSVFPALFPFFVCITALKYAGAFEIGKGGFLETALKIFFTAAISGYAAAALLSKAAFGQGDENGGAAVLNEGEFSTFCAITSLSSPVFITGAVANRILKLPPLALPIAVCHYGTAMLFLGVFILKHGGRNTVSDISPAPPPPLASIFPKAVSDSALIMLKLGGTLVFFSVLTAILGSLNVFNNIPPVFKGIFFGSLELTNGILAAASDSVNLRLKCAVICALLSFGGVCVYMQAAGIACIRPGKYFLTKGLQAVFSGALCYLAYPLFFPASSPASGILGDTLPERLLSIGEIAVLGGMASLIASLLSVFAAKRTKI